MPTENLTFPALTTLAGLSIAIYILVTALRTVWPAIPAKTIALALGLGLSILITILSGHAADPQAILLAIINGALAALAASGGSLVAEAITLPSYQSDPSIAPSSAPSTSARLFRSWR